MRALLATLSEVLRTGEPAVFVAVAVAEGSTPREAGALMLVTKAATAGTIGGGALELRAIVEARAMIEDGRGAATLAIPLGPAIGQCCGGRVTLTLETADAALLARLEALETARRSALPTAMIFGAGHTGRALAHALAPLPLRTVVVDQRPDSLRHLPEGVEGIAAALPEAEVERAPSGTAFLVMTHDHALDFLIGAAALARADAAYVGMIGSRTKREKFRRHLEEDGSGALIGRLTLPIGGSRLRDKRPEVIAALTAAELVTVLLQSHGEKTEGGFPNSLPQLKLRSVDRTERRERLHASAS